MTIKQLSAAVFGFFAQKPDASASELEDFFDQNAEALGAANRALEARMDATDQALAAMATKIENLTDQAVALRDQVAEYTAKVAEYTAKVGALPAATHTGGDTPPEVKATPPPKSTATKDAERFFQN